MSRVSSVDLLPEYDPSRPMTPLEWELAQHVLRRGANYRRYLREGYRKASDGATVALMDAIRLGLEESR